MVKAAAVPARAEVVAVEAEEDDAPAAAADHEAAADPAAAANINYKKLLTASKLPGAFLHYCLSCFCCYSCLLPRHFLRRRETVHLAALGAFEFRGYFIQLESSVAGKTLNPLREGNHLFFRHGRKAAGYF